VADELKQARLFFEVLEKAFEDVLDLRDIQDRPALGADTWFAIGEAGGTIAKAKALVGRDIDDQKRRGQASQTMIQPTFFKLVGRDVVPCQEEGEWLMNPPMRVEGTVIGIVGVSTMFFGIGRPWGPPLLFETMVFHDAEPVFTGYSQTYDEAEAVHKAAVKCVTELKALDGADRTPWWRVQLEEYMSERVTNAGAS
jgi:hypothetical protein